MTPDEGLAAARRAGGNAAGPKHSREVDGGTTPEARLESRARGAARSYCGRMTSVRRFSDRPAAVALDSTA